MDITKQIIHDIINHLENTSLPKGCDLSDVGNEIGIAVGKHINEKELGYELESLIAGIRHGVSLIDGTH